MDNQLPYLPYIKINLVQNVDFIQCVESLHMRLLMQLGRHGYLQLHHSLQRLASSMQLVREQRHGEIVFRLDPRSAPAAGDLSSRKRKSSPDVIGPRHRMPYERHRARRRKLLSDDCVSNIPTFSGPFLTSRLYCLCVLRHTRPFRPRHT